MQVPDRLVAMVRNDDPERIKVELRSVYAPVPPILVAGAAAMTVACAAFALGMVLIERGDAETVSMALSMAALSFAGMAAVFWGTHQSARRLEVQVAQHHLRIVVSRPLRAPLVRTIALGELIRAQVIGEVMVVRTRSGTERIPLPERGGPTREALNQLLDRVTHQAAAEGSPAEIPSQLDRMISARTVRQ